MAVNVPLSPKAQKRIERLKNRKGRKKPAKVPARLTRTSAFAPKRRGLITDSAFRRLYVVPGHSIVHVVGRELGSQHRDALYAVLRLPTKELMVEDAESAIGRSVLLEVRTTWRELLECLNLTAHANNVANLFLIFEELMQVVMTVIDSRTKSQELLLEEIRKRGVADAGFKMRHILHSVEAPGMGLDDKVRVVFGHWMVDSLTNLKLVSLNADVQFALKSDYAKSFWPYIDSFTRHTFVDEEMLCSLVGRELFGPVETSATRRDFRTYCRHAFDDMVKAGGLLSWREEIRGKGREKTRRYHYHLAYPQQMELGLDGSVATS
jgi:hypothetical protein